MSGGIVGAAPQRGQVHEIFLLGAKSKNRGRISRKKVV
jgi:hypothetical protein